MADSPVLFAADLAGVAVFAVSGALAAGRRRLDLFGVVVIAVVTAIGGGTLRDLLLDSGPVFWVQRPVYLSVAAGSGLATFLIVRWQSPPAGALRLADACGLVLFAVLGAETALAQGAPALVAVVMGILSGVAGGAVRDVLCGDVPLVLRGEIYATAALLAAGIYVGARETGVDRTVALAAGVTAGFALRWLAIRRNLRLPIAPEPRDSAPRS